MTSPKVQYLILIAVFLLGLTLPHSDRFIIILAIFFIPIAIILLGLVVYFAAITVAYRKSNKQKFVKGRTGLLAIFILLLSPFLSVFTVDRYYKHKSNQLMKELEVYKKQNGEYPTKIERLGKTNNFWNVHYIYYPFNKNYALSYKSRGMVTTKYDNFYRHWRNYGWND